MGPGCFLLATAPETFFGYAEHYRGLNPMTAADYARAVSFYDRYYARFLPEDRTAKVLDLGCGGGYFLHYLKVRRYVNFLGVDQDSDLVRTVRERITPNVREEELFRFLEAEEDGAWRAVVLNDIVEHVRKEDALRLLKEIQRVLSIGGNVLIKTINMSNPLGMRSRYIDLTHEQGYTEESLPQLLRAAGLRPVHIGPAELGWANGLVRLVLSPLFRFHGRIPQVVTANLFAVATR